MSVIVFIGINEDVKKKMKAIKICKHWEVDFVETTFRAESRSRGNYGLLALAKSSDEAYISCIYGICKVEFSIAPNAVETKGENSILFGLINWMTYSTEEKKTYIGYDMIEKYRNYFRSRVLEKMKSKGDIGSINYV